jgi:hypothetical protein
MQATCTSWAGLVLSHYSSCSTDQLTRHKQPGIKPATKTDPKKTRCFAPGYLLAHALTPRAAAYTQRRPKYFALTVNKPLDKSTHDIM